MNWFRVDTSLSTHPKLHALAHALKMDHARAIGYLIAFWAGVAEHAESGDLVGVPDATIELWAHWRGRRGFFAATLRGAGFIDGATVHGWAKRHEYMLRERARKIESTAEWNRTRTLRADSARTARGARADSALGFPLPSSPTTTTPLPPSGGEAPTALGQVLSATDLLDAVDPTGAGRLRAKRVRKSSADPDTVPIPEDLSPQADRLRQWLRYKRERGQGYQPLGLASLWGRARALGSGFSEAVEFSMSANYAGLVAPKNGAQGGPGAASSGENDWPPGYQPTPNGPSPFDVAPDSWVPRTERMRGLWEAHKAAHRRSP